MNNCPRCKNRIDETDHYCRHCGKSLQPGRGFLFSHTGIILMALVLGPFALPFVWFSKLIGPAAKWIYTGILAAAGVYLIFLLYHSYMLMRDAVQVISGGFI